MWWPRVVLGFIVENARLKQPISGVQVLLGWGAWRPAVGAGAG